MNDFFNNISRYPRFFISSMAGLVLVILTPFRNLFKIKRLQLILPLVLSCFLILLVLTLKNMVAL